MKQYLALTAAALLCANAAAQAPAEGAGSPFDALDADKSGSVSQQEAQAHSTVSQNFASADANTDGNLTREEFDAAFRTGQTAPQPQPEPQPPQSR